MLSIKDYNTVLSLLDKSNTMACYTFESLLVLLPSYDAISLDIMLNKLSNDNNIVIKKNIKEKERKESVGKFNVEVPNVLVQNQNYLYFISEDGQKLLDRGGYKPQHKIISNYIIFIPYIISITAISLAFYNMKKEGITNYKNQLLNTKVKELVEKQKELLRNNH